MDWLKKLGKEFVGFFKQVDHVIVITFEFLKSFFTGDEIRQAVAFAVKAGETYIANEAKGITQEFVNSDKWSFVVQELIKIGIPQVKAQGLAGVALNMVDNGVHDVISFIDNHIAADEQAAGVSDTANGTSVTQVQN